MFSLRPDIWEKVKKNSPDIVGLDLTGKVTTDDDVSTLVSVLVRNTHVHRLTIQGGYQKTGITDASATLLSQCKCLRYLDLSFNLGITDKGLRVLVELPVLKTLYLRGCSVTPLGVSPFLSSHIILDLRIAISAAQEVAIVKAQEIEKLTIDQLNQSLKQFVQENSADVSQLPKPIQTIANSAVQNWEDSLVTGMTLARHFTKIDSPKKNIAEVYLQKYQQFYGERQAQMQFRPVVKEDKEPEDKRRKVDLALERKKSRSLTPPLGYDYFRENDSHSLTPDSQPERLSGSLSI